jgi:hypothetical protein
MDSTSGGFFAAFLYGLASFFFVMINDFGMDSKQSKLFWLRIYVYGFFGIVGYFLNNFLLTFFAGTLVNMVLW